MIWINQIELLRRVIFSEIIARLCETNTPHMQKSVCLETKKYQKYVLCAHMHIYIYKLNCVLKTY